MVLSNEKKTHVAIVGMHRASATAEKSKLADFLPNKVEKISSKYGHAIYC